MNEIIEVLTTKEYIIIYVIAIISCLISYLIYKYDTNKDRRRKKQNTKELNKLVESVSEEIEEYDYDYNQEPELITIEPVNYDAKDALIEKGDYIDGWIDTGIDMGESGGLKKIDLFTYNP